MSGLTLTVIGILLCMSLVWVSIPVPSIRWTNRFGSLFPQVTEPMR